MEALQYFIPFIKALALCTPRLLTVFLVVPFFNTDMITGVTRNCLVIIFTLIVVPTVLPFMRTNDISAGFVFLTMIKEGVIGALIGWLAGLFFHAVAMVGQIVDSQRGASSATMTDPSSGEQTTIMGSLFSQLSITLFFTGGGFFLFLGGVYETYRVWPIQNFRPHFDPAFVMFFLEKIDDCLALAVLLASPILIPLFLSELGLGLINRFAPQLNVFFLSMPIKSAVGMAVLIFYLRFLMRFMQDGFVHNFDFVNLLGRVMH